MLLKGSRDMITGLIVLCFTCLKEGQVLNEVSSTGNSASTTVEVHDKNQWPYASALTVKLQMKQFI